MKSPVWRILAALWSTGD